jgi:hypothetical protein
VMGRHGAVHHGIVRPDAVASEATLAQVAP